MAPTAHKTPDRILEAAFTVFSNYPLADSSMALIAEEAGLSRPALYQYFDDKNDIYRAMLEHVLNRAADRAIAALNDGETMRAALTGFIQESWADERLWRLSRRQGPDLIAAKAGYARPVLDAHYARLVGALRAHLKAHAAPDQQVDGWIDMVRYSPLGFGYDQPTRTTFQRRLAALAATLADSVESRLELRTRH